MGRLSVWVLLGLTLLAVSLHGVQVSAEVGPSESECRPFIEKALHELKGDDGEDSDGIDSNEVPPGLSSASIADDDDDSNENPPTEVTSQEDDNDDDNSKEDDNNTNEETDDDDDNKTNEADDSKENDTAENDSVENTDDQNDSGEAKTIEIESEEDNKSGEEQNPEANNDDDDDNKTDEQQDNSNETKEGDQDDDSKENNSVEQDNDTKEDDTDSKENDTKEDDNDSKENDTKEDNDSKENDTKEDNDSKANDTKEDNDSKENDTKEDNDSKENDTKEDNDSKENDTKEDNDSNENNTKEDNDTKEDDNDSKENDTKEDVVDSKENDTKEDTDSKENDTKEDDSKENTLEDDDGDDDKKSDESAEIVKRSIDEVQSAVSNEQDSNETAEKGDDDSKEDTKEDTAEEESEEKKDDSTETKEDVSEEKKESDEDSKQENDDNDSDEGHPEDDLLLEFDIPKNLRDRKHISELLHLDDISEPREEALHKVADVILKDLKRIYETNIKPLETTYKYRDLSNRHFGDPEIFSKPLVLFMGPWSGGKSTLINYLTNNEYTMDSLRTGAEPSPAYFNILMHGDVPEVLDGTQLAADWTFSGLQKFGQGLEERIRGLRLPSKLLEKVNIVEIPGILEVRKQVSRVFPFNDACQWFIDRADIIFLVYDPAKLDVGPETEAILDQLKGREYQTRIILNKADTVKPEELMRVQSALIWNISPLMSSAQPPVMYTTSLWSHPYEAGSPARLLQAQERSFLRDLRTAIDKRIENKIASARRFAVRVRNHAKMVDCYLTTYYNHKSLFGNKKQITDQIIEHPQNYHIYEGLSTLTNISRYDLPDPEVYRDFFRLNNLYEFKKLSETCTYFRGCPINKLDISIAYDLPELVGKYKKSLEGAFALIESEEANPSAAVPATKADGGKNGKR